MSEPLPTSSGSPLSRLLWSLLIVVFFAGHVALSVRSAWLQDDRYGWRMFHNVGFYRLRYTWIMEDGTHKRYVPGRHDVVRRGRRVIIPSARGRWRASWYSDGTIRNIIETYVRSMGGSRRPPHAVAFQARLELRINDSTDSVRHIYTHPPLEVP